MKQRRNGSHRACCSDRHNGPGLPAVGQVVYPRPIGVAAAGTTGCSCGGVVEGQPGPFPRRRSRSGPGVVVKRVYVHCEGGGRADVSRPAAAGTL